MSRAMSKTRSKNTVSLPLGFAQEIETSHN